MREVTIYALQATGTDQYLYVGATTDMVRRRRAGYAAKRIAAVLEGLAWEMVALEVCPMAQSPSR